jgi:MFS family permease
MSQAMILLDVTIVNVALPSIQQELHVQPANLEWVVGAYTLVLAALILVGGTLGDRFGRKRVFLVGLCIFTLASAGCALSQDDKMLIAFRALQGVGGAAMAALTLSILVHAYDPEHRTSAVGTWAAISGLGFGLGPVLGGLLIQAFDWSAIFWVNVPIGVACGAVALVAVEESRDPQARRLDVLGALLAAGGLFLLTFALIEQSPNMGVGARPRLIRRRRSRVGRVRRLGAPGRVADGATRLGSQPAFRRREHRVRAVVFRAVGHVLLGHAVLPGRSRLVGAQNGPVVAAVEYTVLGRLPERGSLGAPL